MASIGIFYGSSSGVTKAVAERLAELLDVEDFNVFNMEEDFTDFDDMFAFDILLFGCSTWGSGEVQNDWRDPLLDLDNDKPSFAGKTIALFGAGDFKAHGEQFVSALGILHDKFKARGATLVGGFPTEGYTYKYSFAERDGKFVGLPFDEVNEADKTEERLQRWVAILQEELALAEA
ncbi:MAG: flavodoxin [Dechloromonas sp.]|nr:MAG: flavodoxin [Dechloromonas sp.]